VWKRNWVATSDGLKGTWVAIITIIRIAALLLVWRRVHASPEQPGHLRANRNVVKGIDDT